MLNTTKTTKTMACKITVRRPNGDVETVRHPTIARMTEALWSQMQAAMAKAGRGQCLSYENIVGETKRTMSLEEQRQDLFRQLSEAIDAERAAMERAHQTSVMQKEYPKLVAAIKTLETEIATFDAEHPEILSAKRAADKEKAMRHMWD